MSALGQEGRMRQEQAMDAQKLCKKLQNLWRLVNSLCIQHRGYVHVRNPIKMKKASLICCYWGVQETSHSTEVSFKDVGTPLIIRNAFSMISEVPTSLNGTSVEWDMFEERKIVWKTRKACFAINHIHFEIAHKFCYLIGQKVCNLSINCIILDN